MTKKEKKKFKIDKYLIYIIILTILGFGVIFRISDIFPFGTKPVNLIDFDSGYVPVYYKLWDVLHGQSTLWFDWNLGLGLNGFGSIISNGMISPLCWIIGVFPRSSIPYTMSFIYLIKLIFISIMAYIGISKIFPKADKKNVLLFALMYTFSGWTYMMSTNLLYLDAVAIYPLLVYAFKELIEKGKWKLYLVLLTLTLLLSYYIAWLDLFFIIGTTGISLLVMKTDNKKEKAVKVLVLTLLSLAISCIIFLPAFMVAKQSARMANNTSDAGILAYFRDKSIYLFTLAIPFVLTIKQLFVKKDKRLNIFIIAMLVFLLLGVVIEPINALWHTGSHSGFPFRYAYQPTFFTILVSIYYLTNNYKPIDKASIIRTIIPIATMIFTLVLFFLMKDEISERNQFAKDANNWPDYLYLLLLFVILIVGAIFAMRNSKKVSYILLCAMFGTTTLVYGVLFEQFIPSSTGVFTEKIYETINLKDDGYNYMSGLKDMNLNYPFILKVPSIHNRFHFVRQEQLDQIKTYGYYNVNTMIYSAGGTDFSNLLLQNKYYLTTRIYDEDFYNLINTYTIEDEKVSYYETKYNLNHIIPYNGKDYNDKSKNPYETANSIYKELFDGKKDLYNTVEYKEYDDKFTAEVKKNNRYYLYAEADDFEGIEAAPSDGNILFEYFLFDEGKGIVVLKAKNNATVVLNHKEKFKSAILYTLDMDEYKKFVESASLKDVKMETNGAVRKYEVNLDEDKHILIPTNYDPNFIIKVNGEVVDYKCNLYNMLSIDLKKGNNVIEIEYNQKWFKLGVKITLVSLAILLIFYFINKKFRILNCKIIVWPLFIIACLAFAALIIKVYILSWI